MTSGFDDMCGMLRHSGNNLRQLSSNLVGPPCRRCVGSTDLSVEPSHSLKGSDRRRNTPTLGQNPSESLCAGMWDILGLVWLRFGPDAWSDSKISGRIQFSVFLLSGEIGDICKIHGMLSPARQVYLTTSADSAGFFPAAVSGYAFWFWLLKSAQVA